MSRARDFADLAGSADAGGLTGRNLIINGAMQVAQRSGSRTGRVDSAYYTCDRWKQLINNLGSWTIQQSTTAPDGFSNSLKLDCTTADASPAAGDFLFVRQTIEAQNLQHLAYGTSGAVALTLSFYVRSNKTGNASIQLNQVDNSNRSFITTYNIGSADTWEYKTISIPADTSGLFNNDNGAGLEIDWWLNSGSTYQGSTPATGWATEVTAARNNTNLGIGGSTDDEWYITGVQLEVGEQATPFEHRSFGDELARCQRYYHVEGDNQYQRYGVGFAYATNGASVLLHLPTAMRTTPAVSNASVATLALNYGADTVTALSSLSINTAGSSEKTVALSPAVSSGLTAGQVVLLINNNDSNAYIALDAEL